MTAHVMCTCLVQSGQIMPAVQDALYAGLSDFAARAFGAKAEISWTVVPTGNGFTAGHPSTASVVSFRAPTPVPQSERVALLHELSRLWITTTGCKDDELVAVVSDPNADGRS